MSHNRRYIGLAAVCLLLSLVVQTRAHDGSHASVHDTVAAIIQRMQRELTADQLIELTVSKVESLLTARERKVLGTAHIRFRVNVPVVATILRDTSLGDEPFWLRERGFSTNGLKAQFTNHEFDAW